MQPKPAPTLTPDSFVEDPLWAHCPCTGLGQRVKAVWDPSTWTSVIYPRHGKLGYHPGHLTYLWDPQNPGRQVGQEHPVHQTLGRNEHSESPSSLEVSVGGGPHPLSH